MDKGNGNGKEMRGGDSEGKGQEKKRRDISVRKEGREGRRR